MRSSTATAITFIASLLLAAGNPVAAADAGSIQQVSGNVTIIGADKAQRKAGARDRIQSGDTLLTESRSEAVVKMADDSAVVLRPNTQFQFTDFKFEQKPTDTSIVTLLRGTARLISGLIGKASPSRVSVVAPTATIGIRGTDFEVSVIQADTPEARAGVYNYVHDGGTSIRIASGQSLDVQKDQTAFAPERPNPGEEPLQLLRERPIFLQQGGGLDALIQSITIMPPMIMR
jgi:hypothetical protein